MTREMLYDAITEVRDGLVLEAIKTEPAKKRVPWLKYGSIAAAFAMVIGLGAGVLTGKIPGLGGMAGSSGHDGSSTFMSYVGPVFPLTALEGEGGLTATRDLTYDFSPWTPVWRSVEDMAEDAIANGSVWTREQLLEEFRKNWPEGGYSQYSNDLLVTDSYTLTNPTSEDKAVTLLYPFVSSFGLLSKYQPTLTAGGTALEPQLHAGVYSGGFQGAIGADDQETGSVNLKQFNSWEGYRDLLADGRYRDQALDAFPDLSNVPVTVYEFTDAWGQGDDYNTHIHASFSLDCAKTKVLNYGFSGACVDPEAGTMDRSFGVPKSFWPDWDNPQFLIVIGEPLTGWRVFATSDGAPDAKEDLAFGVEAGVTVRQYETDLESALRPIAKLMFHGTEQEHSNSFELYFGLMKLDMVSYGILSDAPVERYDLGDLEVGDFDGVNRVFYLETEVTIPAGGSVTVEASFHKAPSFDYHCAHTKNQGVYGYDMVTRLGTTLEITDQTARAVNTQYTEIVRQNYGFDWENGVDAVTLDPDVEHYYLEVRRTED